MSRPDIRVTGTHLPSEEFDAIVKEAEAIAAEVKKSEVKDTKIALDKASTEASDAFLKKVQDEHRDFATSFPLILRWTVQTREFNTQVFKRFLRFYQKNAGGPNALSVFPTRERFLEVQAEYLILLYRHNHPRATAVEIRTRREDVVKKLLEEDKEFTDAHKELAEEEKATAERADKERRLAVRDHLLRTRSR